MKVDTMKPAAVYVKQKENKQQSTSIQSLTQVSKHATQTYNFPLLVNKLQMFVLIEKLEVHIRHNLTSFLKRVLFKKEKKCYICSILCQMTNDLVENKVLAIFRENLQLSLTRLYKSCAEFFFY